MNLAKSPTWSPIIIPQTPGSIIGYCALFRHPPLLASVSNSLPYKMLTDSVLGGFRRNTWNNAGKLVRMKMKILTLAIIDFTLRLLVDAGSIKE